MYISHHNFIRTNVFYRKTRIVITTRWLWPDPSTAALVLDALCM